MANLKRVFIGSKMNKDIEERLLPNGTYVHALNVDVSHSEGDDAGGARNVKGNTKVGDLYAVTGFVPDSSFETIGCTKSEANNTLYYCIASDYFDGIYEYSEISGDITRIMQSNKATPSTPSKLNFSKDYKIRKMDYLDGKLFITDNYNEPFYINVARAKSYGIDDSRINEDKRVMVPAPVDPPMIDMEQETGQENNMEERFLQFAYRWKYVDNRFSAMSPFSGTAFVPDDYFLDYGAGENRSMLNQKNRVRVTMRTGSQFVEEVELILRDSKSPTLYVVESFNKEQLDLLDNNVFDFVFTNNKKYRALPPSQLGRLYDNVPIKAGAQEIIGRRLAYADYEQGYDIVDSNGNEIKIDLHLSHKNKYWVPGGKPLQTMRSDRDYEVAIVYGDDDGRVTTPLVSENNTTYIQPEYSVTANSLLVEINNKPPVWASNYRILIKQSKKQYYSVFPILYYADGMYRYFLINSFDRDKVKEGEYVIFKASNNGPTQSNKKYKVLEVSVKGTNFLNLNSINEIPGLYFKIKVDDSSEFSQSSLFTHSKTSKGQNGLISVGGGGIGVWQQAQDIFYQAIAPNFSNTPAIYSTWNWDPFSGLGNTTSVVDDPIHYGEGDPNILSVPNRFSSSGPTDLRFTVKIISQTEFIYTTDISEGSGWSTPVQMSPGNNVPLIVNGVTITYIKWQQQGYYTVNDRWKITYRYAGHLTGNLFGGVGVPRGDVNGCDFGDWGGAAILPGNGWGIQKPLQFGPNVFPTYVEDRPIEQGAVIRIRVIEDSTNPIEQEPVQQFPPSPRKYNNIEEWFIESGAYQNFIMYDQNGNNVGAKAISFRRGIYINGSTIYRDQIIDAIPPNYYYATALPWDLYIHKLPVRMLIQGFGAGENTVTASIEIQQTENLSSCETESKDVDLDIYHETTRTYPIENGRHKVTWSYQDFTFPSWSVIDGVQYTNLGQLIPELNPTNVDGMEPHYFQVGDRVKVYASSGVFSTVYSVLAVPNKYNIVVNQISLGVGPPAAGKVGFSHIHVDERDQNGPFPATLLINHCNQYDIYLSNGALGNIVGTTTSGNTNSTFNAYCFGNGLESDRIRDNFNSTTLEYSPRASTPIENYGRERKSSSVCYSEIYNEETSTNRLNEFNLSLVNFKNIDPGFGSIQRIFARDTNLVIFQENKVSVVLFNKTMLTNSDGSGNVSATNSVFGSQVSYIGEWGISFNPESFAQWGDMLFFTDGIRGAVLMMVGTEIKVISDDGMSDYFRDLFKNDPNTRKIGAFDPYRGQYVIASNDDASRPCDLVVEPSGRNYDKYGNFVITGGSSNADFTITSNTNWTASIAYSSGTGWVTGFPTSGFGDQEVFLNVATNNTFSNRTATITITYCGGLTDTYIITQAKSTKIKVIIMAPGPTIPTHNPPIN